MKKKLIIIGSVLVLLIGAFTLLYPSYLEKKEMKSLKEEIVMVKEYLNGSKMDYSFKENITTGKRKVLEDSIEAYLHDILKEVDDLKENIHDENININNLQDEDKNLKDNNTKLEEIKKNILNIKKDDYVKDDTYKDLYNELLDDIKLDNYINMIDEKINYNNENIKIVDYLLKNKSSWKLEDNKIIFLKRKTYNDYKNNYNNLDYQLINDKTSPKINASDITIYKGNKVDIKSKVKCIDDVDDNVECKVSGSYDINKVGTYNISITSTDLSKNTANKTIKLIVKEKQVKKNPYYVEVVRNQNVVIVYGLDKNNEYTKIVKVFICSTGLNNKTPTGIFKTSDKASWGWLSGNVYGQYYTRITGDILFHSVPYFKKAKNQLEWEEYNKLGTFASKGCVRMTVRDVKWIYDNCPKGTQVKIYDGNLPSGVIKPSATKIDASSPNKGWDPTDPDKNNPWKK